jgi:hypothetical protein
MAVAHRAGVDRLDDIRFKDDKGERFVTVLQIPPAISPETAVKVAIAAEVKGKK